MVFAEFTIGARSVLAFRRRTCSQATAQTIDQSIAIAQNFIDLSLCNAREDLGPRLSFIAKCNSRICSVRRVQ